ncbi:retrovirus-related pol polyprotein from transposon TNT 1-94 [Tanacetum coccineum]
MEISIADQIALDDALVAPADRLKIGKCNLRLSSDITSKEATLQVVYDVLKLTPFYNYKAVRLRYSDPMIQPEPEGSTQGYPLVSVEVLSHGPSDAMHNPLPATQSQKDFVSKLTEIHSFLLTFSLRNIRVNSFTMKMEILLEPTSNKLMVGNGSTVGRPHGSEGFASNQSWLAKTKPIRYPCFMLTYSTNFDTMNLLSKNNIVTGLPKLKSIKDHLCSSCELGKAKRKSFHNKTTPSSKRRLQLLHMDLCGPMRVESINGKKYVLVIVDDYSRYTWTHFLKSKDETPAALIDFLTLVQRGLHAQVRTVRTDKGMKFLNKTLHAYFAKKGIRHETSTTRTPKQNGFVERWNHTLVEAARTMLNVAKVLLFFWSEAIATACFTQNRSLVIPRHEKTPYHIISGRKPSVKFFHFFGSFCYIVRDGENLNKMKEKCDARIFVGYSTQSRAYRIFNKRTRIIIETIHVNFDELRQMASDHVSFDPVPQCPKTALEHDSLSPGPQSQENVP